MSAPPLRHLITFRTPVPVYIRCGTDEIGNIEEWLDSRCPGPPLGSFDSEEEALAASEAAGDRAR